MCRSGDGKTELEELDAWLNDPDARPYGLLVAPIGRGKSALLVHWSKEVAARGDHTVIFFPISIRFDTNEEAGGSAYLRGKLSRLLPSSSAAAGSAMTIEEILHACLSTPLQDDMKLLLVIDAIDEAADWKPRPYWFPTGPENGYSGPLLRA
jgi:hypothetical protein